MKREKVKIITLGCAKNTVDSEVLAGILENNGIEVVEDSARAETVIINTCSFIEKAREESIDVILEAALEKTNGNIKKLIVAGCMSERYGQQLAAEIPEIDEILGIDEIPEILNFYKGSKRKRDIISRKSQFLYDHTIPRKKLTPPGVSYIKVSDGCDNRCAYCAIPAIRGNLRSRSIESILNEAENLARNGTVEINLLANDLTSFGKDKNEGENLASLLSALSNIENLKWIRPLYLYPSRIDEKLIETIASKVNICNYFDMPIQHTDNTILQMMERKYKIEEVKETINRIRAIIPDAVFRTTFITGFPAETDERFERIIEFIEEMKLDWIGVFAYSKEEGTKAKNLTPQIPLEKAEERAMKIEEVQKKISAAKLASLRGKRCEAIIEAQTSEKNIYEGRIRSQAPEVDGMAFISGEKLECGKIYTVEIDDTLDFDVWATVCND
ncbi:MAG: 30S ribosomal protein S12 methylthiotransferase RimO [Candidatus Schekmanbacteria bacterium]|nr:MAG: 30S ribosomal protein S12 methylthiotransferase RimO [Candidatus Schekmanbacteria bacterium]